MKFCFRRVTTFVRREVRLRLGVGLACLAGNCLAAEGVTSPDPQTLEADVPLVKVAEYRTLEKRFAPAAVPAGKFIYIIGGLGADDSALTSIERFDVEKNINEPYAKLNVGRFGHRAVLIGKKIYVLGGSQPGTTNSGAIFSRQDANALTKGLPRAFSSLDSEGANGAGGFPMAEMLDGMEVVDLTNASVTKGPRMPAPLSGFSVVPAEKSFRIFGGKIGTADGRGYTNASYVYDVDKKSWSKGQPIPRPGEVIVLRVDPAHLVAVGGYNGRASMADVFALNELTGTWVSLPPLVRAVSAASAVYLGQHVFLFGDYAHPENITIYALMTKKSENLQLHFTPTRHSAAVVCQNRIYVIDGKPFTEAEPLAVIQVFALTKAATPDKKAKWEN